MRPMMMMRVVAMMLVVRRIRKACRGKQQQRNRDSDDLTHDSTYSTMNGFPGTQHSLARAVPRVELRICAHQVLHVPPIRIFLATTAH
jgi:hypothetical protein